MIFPQMLLDVEQEINIVGFAGLGGWCHGFYQATGRDVHLAINHDDDAISVHRANHPQTHHIVSDIYEVALREVIDRLFGGRPVGALHISPDCRDHSGAKNGKPIRDVISRSLAWVGIRWVGQVRPRIFTLENVPEWMGWDRLVAKRCKETGRVLKLDGTVAAPGERVPVQEQQLERVCTKKSYVGKRFRRFVEMLREMGYEVEWKILRASDYAAPTKRERLFLIARCDGVPIVWPKPTHGDPKTEAVKRGRRRRWRTTGECVDWSVPIPSIFLTREQAKQWGRAHGRRPPKRPLVGNTHRRLARGVARFALEDPDPYLVRGRDAEVIAAGLTVPRYGERPGQQPRSGSLREPAPTVVPGGNGASLVAVHVSTYHGETREGEVRGSGMDRPADTVDCSNRHAVVAAFLARHNEGGYTGAGLPLDGPAGAVCAKGSPQEVVAISAFPNTTGSAGYSGHEPAAAVTTAGNQALIAAWLTKYYGQGIGQALTEPGHTATTKDRFGLVVTRIEGEPRVLTDIGMRMFTPRENARIQGFPDDFIIDRGHDGRKITQETQLRLIGNAVPPQFAKAIIQANAPELIVRDEALPVAPKKRRVRKAVAA